MLGGIGLIVSHTKQGARVDFLEEKVRTLEAKQKEDDDDVRGQIKELSAPVMQKLQELSDKISKMSGYLEAMKTQRPKRED